jgi:flagellin
MIVNTNTIALATVRQVKENESALARSLARLSSGSKIVQPIDDVAGSAESFRLTVQVHGIAAARANVANAVSFTQTQDGYLRGISKALNLMSELSVLAQDGTKNDSDRQLYQAEFNTLSAHIADASTKQFNGIPLFSGETLNVTTDEDGNTFPMNGIDLSAAEYFDGAGGRGNIGEPA